MLLPLFFYLVLSLSIVLFVSFLKTHVYIYNLLKKGCKLFYHVFIEITFYLRVMMNTSRVQFQDKDMTKETFFHHCTCFKTLGGDFTQFSAFSLFSNFHKTVQHWDTIMHFPPHTLLFQVTPSFVNWNFVNSFDIWHFKTTLYVLLQQSRKE